MNFTRNSAGELKTAAWVAAFHVLSSALLARLLSVPDRGYYGLVVALAAILVTPSAFGWPQTIVYRIRRLNRPASRILPAAVLAMSVTGTVAIALAVLFRDFLRTEALGGAAPWMFAIAIVLVPGELLLQVFSAGARAIDRFDLENRARIVEAGVLPFAFAFGLLASDGSVAVALIILLAARLMHAAWLGFRVHGQVGRFAAPERGDLGSGFLFGAKSASSLGLSELHRRADVFMLAALLGEPALVAIYVVAVGVAEFSGTLSDATGKALLPQLAGLEPGTAARFTVRVTRTTSVLTAAMGLGICAVAPLAVPLVYGDQYSACVVPLLWLAAAMIPRTCERLLVRYFTAIDRQEVTVGVQSASLAANVVLNLILIPRFGVVGAAAASLGSYSLAALMSIATLLRNLDVREQGGVPSTREDLVRMTRALRSALPRFKFEPPHT